MLVRQVHEYLIQDLGMGDAILKLFWHTLIQFSLFTYLIPLNNVVQWFN